MAGWRTWWLQMHNQEVHTEIGIGREGQGGEKGGGGGSRRPQESGLINNASALA